LYIYGEMLNDMTVNVKRTTSADPDFVELTEALDRYLAIVDGDDHVFYDQFNKIQSLPYALVMYCDQIAVACGACKPFDVSRVEIKRMYCKPTFRGRGYATAILSELEAWAKELGFTGAVLETGLGMKDAISLYTGKGYTKIENYGQYMGVENSVCFEKRWG